LRPNDNIFLNAAPKQLSVFGASGLNATIDFGPSGKSLDQVLADAGGLLDLEADPKGVFVMREEKPHLAQRFSSDLTVGPGPVRVIYRADLTNTVSFFHMRDFQMQEGDIVYVATSPSNGLQKFIRLLLGVNTVATVAGGGGN
jgi:polysaccharide export outer membrane protein